MKKLLSAILISTFIVTGCSSNSSSSIQAIKEVDDSIKFKTYENANYVDYVDRDDIIREKSNMKDKYGKYYDKYITYTVPNGKKIYIIAGNKVSDEQVLKAYNVLSFYLEDKEGYDMKKVANSMGDKGAAIYMPNGADGRSDVSMDLVPGQPLYQMEVPTEGDKWYIENDYNHRDASYEEIFHLVHDLGIGLKKNPAALPEIQEKIYLGMKNALPENKDDWGKKGLWGYGSKDWLVELEKEGSLEQEYIVSVIDSYYGLWAPYTESKGGMWGLYIAKDRDEVKKKDPTGYEIIKNFLPDNITYMARINPEFNGTFKMYYDEQDPYTYKSRYLVNSRLVGDKDNNLIGNKEDNILIGNKGDNKIDGKKGIDAVQFSGVSTEYNITNIDGKITVKDKKNRDGEDVLVNIEILRFTDKDIRE